jgi:hypothetical protein
MAWAQVALGVAFAVAIGVLVARAVDPAGAGAGDDEEDGAALLSAGAGWHAVGRGLAVGAAALAVAAAPAWMILRRRPRAWATWQAVAYAALVALFFNFHAGPNENARSPKPVAARMLALLGEGGRTVRFERLPEQVAVYLPVDPDAMVPPRYRFSGKVLAVIDDSRGVRERRKRRARYEDAPYDVRQFRSWVADGTVTEARRVPLEAAPGDARWKLFELTVDRRGLAGVGEAIGG